MCCCPNLHKTALDLRNQLPCTFLQAQGLARLIGSTEAIAMSVYKHGIVLAAHGPYSASGASEVLGCPIECVNQNFASFDGLAVALEQAFT